MARKQRDYKAEYRARLERGRLRGLSTKESRGHGQDKRKRDIPRGPGPIPSPKYEDLSLRLRNGGKPTDRDRELIKLMSPEEFLRTIKKIAQRTGLKEHQVWSRLLGS